MGNKIHPISLRVGVVRDWPSRWFFTASSASGERGLKLYRRFLEEDEAIREVVMKKVGQAGIAGIEIERTTNALRVTVRAARPGFVIGRGGKGIEELTEALGASLKKIRKGKVNNISVNVEELKRTDVSASYIAQQIAWDMEKRMPFRRVMNRQLDQLSQNRDVKGARIVVSGRLDGGEIARREWKGIGSLPLQTLRADIEYGVATAFCSYVAVGVKVWIYKGEIFMSPKKKASEAPS